jgi:hypothetical protein
MPKRVSGNAASLLIAILVWVSCSDTPTSPHDCSDAADVFRTEAFYVERAEFEEVFEGRLTKNCAPPTPSGRDHCFYIGQVPVYSGSHDQVLNRYVGDVVRIRGKLVTVLGKEEIWPAALCRQS